MVNTNNNNPSCYCDGKIGNKYYSLTKEQRIKLLKAAYLKTRYQSKVVWKSPSKKTLVSGDGYRAPIQFYNGNGYSNPTMYSGTDGWGATLAQPTMDNLSGFGIDVGISGFSSRNGYCVKTTCSNGCNEKCGDMGHNCCKKKIFPASNLPELPGETVTSAADYLAKIKDKYGKNDYYCNGCITNSRNDPHFINADEGMFFRNSNFRFV